MARSALYPVLVGAVLALALAAAPLAVAAPQWPWLGLNENSAKYLGPVDTFLSHGIVYDRSFELTAGQLPSELEKGNEAEEMERRFAEDREDGMIPVVVIEFRGYGRAGYEYRSDPAFPQPRTRAEEAAGANTSKGYVEGFVRSAAAILRLAAAGGHSTPVLFEPMNEPWGYTTPQNNGAEYANVIAELIPAAVRAGIPATSIYVGARSGGWVPAMYGAQPSLRSAVQGWYVHPYGPPPGQGGSDTGIQSLPSVRAAMTSGQDNIVVSEVGFCATDVNNSRPRESGGKACFGQQVGDSRVAAADLQGVLESGAAYHEAGWLKALIVYSRNAGGWAMQKYPHRTLTRSGKALVQFADEHAPAAKLVQTMPANPEIEAEEGEAFEEVP
jgi:hypothetical protein